MHSATACAALLIVSLVGCGGGPESEARKPVETYLEALADQDGERACAQLTPAGRRELLRSYGRFSNQRGVRCPDAVCSAGADFQGDNQEKLRDLDIDVEIDEDGRRANATSEEEGSRPIRLEKIGSRWLISGGFAG